jgi:hypothetical protein
MSEPRGSIDGPGGASVVHTPGPIEKPWKGPWKGPWIHRFPQLWSVVWSAMKSLQIAGLSEAARTRNPH